MRASLATLLAIPWRRARNSLKGPARAKAGRIVFLSVIGFLLLATVYALLRLVFSFFSRQAVIGPMLVGRMLSMAFMTFLFMLVYSNLMASLSSHYLSKDLPLLLAAPVRPVRVFLAKSVEALFGSSWMVVMMCLPLFLAYGKIREAPWTFYAASAAVLVPFLLIPAAFSMAVNTGLMFILPARRLREAMLIIGAAMFSGTVLLFRMLDPEKLVTPSDEMQVYEFMKTLRAPAAPWLPSAWIARAVGVAPNLEADPLGYWANLGWLWLAAIAAWIVCAVVADRMFLPSWQQATESMGVRRGVRFAASWLPANAGPYGAILLKDLKVFLREPSQWGQMLLLTSLVGLYLLNLMKIPREEARGLANLLFFFNLGFIGLIITAVAARFLFPLVSLEGRSFAVLRCAPIALDRYLWTRWAAGSAPLVVLGLALVGCSVPLLGVDRYMTVVALAVMTAMTVGIAGLAMGFGAAFAKFRISNPEEIVTSTGGFLFMATSTGLIILALLIPAQPIRHHYYAALMRHPMPPAWPTLAALAGLAALALVAVHLPLRLGAAALERSES